MPYTWQACGFSEFLHFSKNLVRVNVISNHVSIQECCYCYHQVYMYFNSWIQEKHVFFSSYFIHFDKYEFFKCKILQGLLDWCNISLNFDNEITSELVTINQNSFGNNIPHYTLLQILTQLLISSWGDFTHTDSGEFL